MVNPANATLRTSKAFTLLSASFAFMLWGTWAYYVNNDSSPSTRIVSALTQGTASFLITLFMVHAVTWCYRQLSTRWAQLIVPALLTVSVTGTCLACAHYAVGTANILATIAPALSVAFVFCVITAAKLTKIDVAHDGY